MLDINLLGTPEIFLDDQIQIRFRTRKAQALLIYLATTNRKWTRVALATLFWPEMSDVTALKNLRDILPPLRRQLREYLLIEDETIGLNILGQSKCDVLQFRTVLEQQREHINTELLAETLQLYRGEFLEGYATSRISADFELWALREREQLHQLALMGFTTLCQRQQEDRAYDAALVTNRQLLRLVPWDEASHRRQMLLLAQSGQQVAALSYFETCRRILAEELDAEPDAETMALLAEIEAGQHVVPPAPSTLDTSPDPAPTDVTESMPTASTPQKARHNLPRQLTSLIGREDDIAAVHQLLQDESTALLTLVGQGGVGKTRLALSVAGQIRQQAPALFPDGIWYVPLAGLSGQNEIDQIAAAIAQAMGLSLPGFDPLARQLVRSLRDQQLLLVLDNIEPLVSAREFLLEIVQSAQQVKLLVTSREQLQLQAEYLYPVHGLLTPDARDLQEEPVDLLSFALDPGLMQRATARRKQPVPDLQQFDSVQLFVTRVQQRLPDFRLTAKNQRSIGLICRLLGGVPLGIELAAQLFVQEGAATLAQLIAELEQLDPLDDPAQLDARGVAHLRSGAIDLPERQRSIQAVCDYSWRLLTPAEQDLLAHCAIFRGGFTRQAVLTVGAGEGANLLALVTKSLVHFDSHDRYDLHELVRQFVIQKLHQKPDGVRGAAQKHAIYFAELMAGQEETLLQEPEFSQMLQTEVYNIRAMWQWFTQRATLGQVEQAEINHLERCITCFFQFFFLQSQRQEALELAIQAITAVRPDFSPSMNGLVNSQVNSPVNDMETSVSARRLQGYLLANAAEAGVRMKERDLVVAWLDEAKAIGEAFSDAALLSQVYLTLAVLDASGASKHIELFDTALTWAKESARPLLQVQILLAAIPHWIMDPATRFRAASESEELMDLIQTQGYQHLIGDALIRQGMIYRAQENWKSAILSMHQGVEACQNHYGSTYAIRMAHEALGQIYMQLCNFPEAQRWASAALQQSRIQGNQLSILNNLYTLSIVHNNLQNWSASAEVLRELVATSETLGAMQFTILGYMGLGQLHQRQENYREGLPYYEKALHLALQANYPHNLAVIRSAIAVAHLKLGQTGAAYTAIEPLLVDNTLLTFTNRSAIHMTCVAYEVLTARADPRAEPMLERSYTLLQRELAKLEAPELRSAYEGYRHMHRNTITWWEEKQSISTDECDRVQVI